jgi:GDPmannose 4,6-dehydratase
VYSYWQTVNYRESYGMFACNGILFNHESERRGETFVTRKITRTATRIKLGLEKKLYLGNLDAKRDWGFAGDYVEAMWMMLQADQPDDYVVATGEAYSVRQFVDKTFALLDLDPTKYVEIDPRYFRPAEVDFLQGDSSKIRKTLEWKPRVSFDGLVERMVEHDLQLAKREKATSAALLGV